MRAEEGSCERPYAMVGAVMAGMPGRRHDDLYAALKAVPARARQRREETSERVGSQAIEGILKLGVAPDGENIRREREAASPHAMPGGERIVVWERLQPAFGVLSEDLSLDDRS